MCYQKAVFELLVKEKIQFLAERGGFESSTVLLLYTLSKRAPATIRPPLTLIFLVIYHNKIIS